MPGGCFPGRLRHQRLAGWGNLSMPRFRSVSLSSRARHVRHWHLTLRGLTDHATWACMHSRGHPAL
eukprot:2394287-Rhodomonas_salina.1